MESKSGESRPMLYMMAAPFFVAVFTAPSTRRMTLGSSYLNGTPKIFVTSPAASHTSSMPSMAKISSSSFKAPSLSTVGTIRVPARVFSAYAGNSSAVQNRLRWIWRCQSSLSPIRSRTSCTDPTETVTAVAPRDRARAASEMVRRSVPSAQGKDCTRIMGDMPVPRAARTKWAMLSQSWAVNIMSAMKQSMPAMPATSTMLG